MTRRERRVALPSTLSAPAMARAIVAEVLEEVVVPPDLRSSCELLVSEVVTNAVLHGGGEISLRCRVAVDRVRIEVDDGSRTAPAVRDPSGEATTGRGMQLVDSMADAWGVTPGPGGKTVWFELGGPRHRPEPEPARPDGREMRVIVLRDAPVPLLRAAVEWADTATRELAYLVLSGVLEEIFPDGWDASTLSTSALAVVLDELPAELQTADVRFAVPRDSGDSVRRRLKLAELSERLYDEGKLLTPAASEEVRRCRAWALLEVAAQLDGSEPQPWAAARPS